MVGAAKQAQEQLTISATLYQLNNSLSIILKVAGARNLVDGRGEYKSFGNFCTLARQQKICATKGVKHGG
jgi:hypothetical protein